MSTTLRRPGDETGGEEPTSSDEDGPPHCGLPRIELPLGARVLIVSDLRLTAPSTPTSRAVTSQFMAALDSWDGPGLVIVAGNLVSLTGSQAQVAQAQAALSAHVSLRDALSAFSAIEGRRVLHLLSEAERPLVGHELIPGMEAISGPIDVAVATATTTDLVRVSPGPARDADPAMVDSGTGGSWPGPERRSATRSTVDREAPWLTGLDRLSDPSAVNRFIVSRTLYRRIGRYAWLLVIPFVVAALVRIATIPRILNHLGTGLPGRAVHRFQAAGSLDQLQATLIGFAVVLLVLLLVLGFLSRRLWVILGGGELEVQPSAAHINDASRDEARQLLDEQYVGLVTGATFDPEFTTLGPGFFANVGASTDVVRERPSRFGLPPTFLESTRLSWVEIEAGAELHARMEVGRQDRASPSVLERLVVRSTDDAPREELGRGRDYAARGEGLRPVQVASFPQGASWPPAPDLRRAYRRTRRGRRLAAALILLAGAISVIDALTPPLRGRLHVLREVLPLEASVTANTVLVITGLGLLALGRGILRGQRRAWWVAVVVLSVTSALHLVAGLDVEETVVSLLVLLLLVTNAGEFRAEADGSSLRSALLALGLGAAGVILITSISIELFNRVGHHAHADIPWTTALGAVSERLVGITTIGLPARAERFLDPALLAVGLGLLLVALYLLTRPVVDRRLHSGRAAEFRARDIVRRHGSSTLDYFALRSDKQWFFHRDSLVAYAVYGGICLVSPDPIGPRNERRLVWNAFRQFADQQGWITAVMGAGQEWLPIYRDASMHNIYLGDEAVVHTQQFSLAGGTMKGLRQAHNRIKKKGYTASFHDPARLAPELAEELTDLMSLSRQGEHERGFSMMLGRIFDPRDVGLLLVVVRDPDGAAAAMCQFVPSPGIRGFSLDLMRRDPGEHPNGLTDFALCSTIEYMREQGYDGLSLNFAAMRSTLAGERGDGTFQRAERWLLKRLSNFAQIESLWKFNAKYEPEWLPRYVVYDTPEHLAPVVVAILRAESLWEIPVLGRLLSAGAEKRMLAARAETMEYRSLALEAEPLDSEDSGQP